MTLTTNTKKAFNHLFYSTEDFIYITACDL